MKSHRILLISAIIVAAILVYLLYKNHQPAKKQPVTKKNTVITTVSNKAASPTYSLYTVQTGDSLYTIGQHFYIPWDTIAKFNGLSDNANLEAGQILKIPDKNEAFTIQAKTYIITPDDEEKQVLQEAQSYADAGTGQLAYRLVPTEVVEMSPLLAQFQFAAGDLYVQKSIDYNNGTAVVEVTHNGILYTVYLDQPLEKGPKGVWSPVKVTAPF